MFHKHSGHPHKYEAHHSEILGSGYNFWEVRPSGVDFEDRRTLPTAKTPIEIAMDL